MRLSNIQSKIIIMKTLKINKLLILFYLLILSNFAFAQQELYVSGQIVDSNSKEALSFCTVAFYNSDKLINGVATDDNGYFEMALQRGQYTMKIDYMGYKKQDIPVVVQKNNQFLGTFKLNQEAEVLDDVTVTGTTKALKLDKNVYDVTKKLKVAAANTNDVLERINGVSLDRYNGQIVVEGERKVKILVDGIEKDSNYIQNLNPERLSKVEIIKDPSGKYGLEGYGAVINVILKKDYKGTELSVFDQAIIDSDNKNSKYIFPINSMNIGYNYTYNKVNMYLNYDNTMNKFHFPTTLVKTYANGLHVDKRLINNEDNLVQNTVNDGFIVGTDYYINPKNTLSFEAKFGNLFFNKDESEVNYDFLAYNGLIPIDLHLQTERSNSKSNSNYQTVFYSSKLNDSDKLNIDASLSQYTSKNDTEIFKNNVLDRSDSSENTQNRFKLNAEYEKTLKDNKSLNFGYGFNTLTNNTTFNSNNFKYSDTRHKVFGYYAFQLNKKTAVKTGLAAEISRPKALGSQLTYFIYQPYLDLKYNASKKVDFKLKYRSDSHYPSLNEANPNTVVIDNETVSTGNPNLKPSVTHKVSVRSNILQGFLTLEPYYNFSNNYIGQIGNLRTDGTIEYTFDNVGSYSKYGVKASLAVPLAKTLFLQTSTNIYKSSIQYNGLTNTVADFSMDANLVYVNQKKGLTTAMILQRGMNKYIATQGYNKWNNDFLGLMAKKGFYKNKLNIMLLYMLPVDLGLQYKQEEVVNTPTFSSIATHDISLLKNVIVFKLNYRFSKGKSTRKTDKAIDIEEPSKNKGLF